MIDSGAFDSIFSVLRKHNVASFSCPDFQVTFSPAFGYGAMTKSYDDDSFLTKEADEPSKVDETLEAIELAERQNALRKAYGEQF